MSLKLKGHPTLWQWDAGRQLIVLNEDCNEVHFCNGTQENALVCLVKEQNGERVVDVPNILLQQAKTLTAYEHHSSDTEDDTFCGCTFPVRPRSKPADYIYTETELLSYSSLDNRLNKLEGEGLANAVADYLKENPVEAGATAEEAAQIEQNKADIAALERTKLAASELPNAVNEALAQAKASGVFDGEPGKDGQPGADGTNGVSATHKWSGTVLTVTSASGTSSADLKGEPGKDGADGQPGADGKDYVLTEADKQEIAEQAAGMVEVPKVDIPTTLPNPNALTFTGAATGTYDGSAPLTVNIPEGGGVTDEQVETAVNAWLDENGEAALTGGGWRKIATHVWDGNTEYQPLTLDYATGEMTFAEAPPTGKCVWPVPNYVGGVSAATGIEAFYSKIPKEFLTAGMVASFSAGTNGYKFGDVSSLAEGGVNANVDISAFRFEKSGTAPSFTGLNAKRVKVRMRCPGGNFWLNNGSFSFQTKLSNGELLNLGHGTGIATARVIHGIIDQDISVGGNILSQQYSLVVAQCKARTNQNQTIEYRHEDFTHQNRIIPDGVTITDLIFMTGNGNYWPCNGTVVEVYEFVG